MLLFTPGEDGIDLVSDHLAISGGQFPRFTKRNARQRTGAHFAHALIKREAKHPGACTAIGDLEKDTGMRGKP